MATSGSDEAEIRALAATQYGVVTGDQLTERGWTRGRIWNLVRSQRWRPAGSPGSGLLVLAGTPETPMQRAFLAVAEAGPGAALSHWSAAALWGLSGFRLEPVHVLVERGSKDPRRVSLSTLHTTRILPSHHLVSHHGIMTTSPVRTIFDLSGVVPLGKVARTLDDAWGSRLVRADRLFDTLEELRGRGRSRVATMRMLLAERGSGYVAPESGLERRFRRILLNDGQQPLEHQVDLGGEVWVARVDAVDREARLIVQIDGDRYHTALLDRRHDAQQDEALSSLGWTILRLSEFDVWHRPEWVARVVREARARGRAAAARAPA